jgi:hypothetical protein
MVDREARMGLPAPSRRRHRTEAQPWRVLRLVRRCREFVDSRLRRTPAQREGGMSKTAQYLAAVYGWGPASVLKHTLPLPYGPTGSRHAPCNRPDCPLLPCSTTIDWHPANWAPHLSQIYPRRGLESRHPSPDPQRAISSAVSVSRRDSRRTNSSLSAWSRVVAARRTSWSRRRRATSIAEVSA